MIVDSSALVALAMHEPTSGAIVTALLDAPRVSISATTWVEASLVLESRTQGALADFLDQFVARFDAQVIDLTAEHAREAVVAWRAYGRGNDAARLNYGDCMAYAVAKVAGEPLLFVGEDFALTDVEAAL
ncbi:MAG: type II toxin-antitoxin system VapC family toxin [Rhodoglobus sp.]|nr:type II toxin-antitoxin system VapC family toxin [Rhodoglobus sp.]